MNALLFHVLGVRCHGILGRLHEKEEDSLPELLARKCHETHKEKHTVQDRHWQNLEKAQYKNGAKDQDVNKQTSQAGFLDTDSVSVLVLVGHCRNVKDTRDSRGDKPRATDEAVDNDLTGRETSVVVVGFTVRKLVAWVVRNVPSDAVIQPNKDKGKTGGSSG